MSEVLRPKLNVFNNMILTAHRVQTKECQNWTKKLSNFSKGNQERMLKIKPDNKLKK